MQARFADEVSVWLSCVWNVGTPGQAMARAVSGGRGKAAYACLLDAPT
jgi:hypothetical protein